MLSLQENNIIDVQEALTGAWESSSQLVKRSRLSLNDRRVSIFNNPPQKSDYSKFCNFHLKPGN
jgi:hypothetical protein